MTASTTTSTVTQRVAALQVLAMSDPLAAQDAVWAWFQRLGAQLPAQAAELELAQLFAAGTPADVDGQTEGLLVGFLAPRDDLARLGRNILRIGNFVVGRLGLMPWLGKKFDKAAGQGTNSLGTLAVVLSTVLAPKYRHHLKDGSWEGFEMRNWVEESVVSPGTEVLVLDYENFGDNPWPINQIRDEAVQIVRGTYLGAKLLHQDNGYKQLAFWASKTRA